MKNQVIEAIQHPKNLYQETIASFTQVSDAIKFAKQKAKERKAYDNTTPFEYAVVTTNNGIVQRYFNIDTLI